MNKRTLYVVYLRKGVALCGLLMGLWACSSQPQAEFIPQAPDYHQAVLWYEVWGDSTGTGADVFYLVSTWEKDWHTTEGLPCHYADVWNPEHRARMGREFAQAAAYMADGNNFYAPFYRHTTIETFLQTEMDTVYSRTRLPIDDVLAAFDQFTARRDPQRPLILAGFSQGALLLVELLKHIDDATAKQLVAAYVMGYKVTPADTLTCKYIKAAQRADDTGVTICYNTVKDLKGRWDLVSIPCAMCINPVNWTTDSIPGILHDSITVTLSPANRVLITNYPGTEYKPYCGVINVGNLHCCEPWLYSECLRENFHTRTHAWRTQTKE